MPQLPSPPATSRGAPMCCNQGKACATQRPSTAQINTIKKIQSSRNQSLCSKLLLQLPNFPILVPIPPSFSSCSCWSQPVAKFYGLYFQNVSQLHTLFAIPVLSILLSDLTSHLSPSLRAPCTVAPTMSLFCSAAFTGSHVS